MHVSSILGGTTGLVLTLIAYVVTPNLPFMKVHEISYANGMVFADRTIREPERVADWIVSIVPDGFDAPSCQTVLGERVHQGWSRYSPGRTKVSMPINDWVADDDCESHLVNGTYDMFITWTPRDGSDPVTEWLSFDYP